VLRRLPGPPRTVIVSGSGEFIARRLLREQPAFAGVAVVALNELLGPALSHAACAYALAVLASSEEDKETRRRGDKETAGVAWPVSLSPCLPVSLSSAPVPLLVVKVGGSLYDLPDLRARLEGWLDAERARQPGAALVLVPGGGPTADAVRTLDAAQSLGQEAAHWLALRGLTLNAWMLQTLLASSHIPVSADRPAIPGIVLLDAHAFAVADEGQAGCLPHTWDATSDSVAARVALVWRAQELVLLKSRDIPEGIAWDEAARQGWVDALFPALVSDTELRMRVVNLRSCPTGPPGIDHAEGD
jgi:aspartokinase-like uncharacterized kinase